ncbi:MAG TPA: hypothetical protein VMW87_03245 [Spirochaetia bacterium]|nr:hypothetical protein [Spirochaetia bacterium]
MKRRVFLGTIVLCAAFAASVIDAQQLRGKDVILDVSPRLWGLDLGVGVASVRLFPPLDTILWVVAGGAWESRGFFRNPDNSPYMGSGLSVDPASAPYYNRLDLNWRMGVEQGIIGRGTGNRDLLTTFLFLRTEMSRPLPDPNTTQLLFYPGNPHPGESVDDVHVSGLFGFRMDTTARDPLTKVFRGYYAETSIEIGPSTLVDFRTYRVNFGELNLTLKYFLPLYEASPSARGNRFGLYIAERLITDYLWGSAIPLSVRQKTGGINRSDGMGDAIRGLEVNRFDSNLKIINNFSLRATLPALVSKDIVPGAMIFFDAGYYSGLPLAPSGPDNSGFLASTGAGFSIDLLDLGDASIYTAYLLSGSLVTGGAWTPIALELGLHY